MLKPGTGWNKLESLEQAGTTWNEMEPSGITTLEYILSQRTPSHMLAGGSTRNRMEIVTN